MKKIYLILFVGILLISCGTPQTDEEGFSKPQLDANKIDANGNANWYVERLGNCQYLLGYRRGMHKGDCDNPIHVYNK